MKEYKEQYEIIKRLYSKIFDLENNKYSATTQEFNEIKNIMRHIYKVNLSDMVSCVACAREIRSWCEKFISEYEAALCTDSVKEETKQEDTTTTTTPTKKNKKNKFLS